MPEWVVHARARVAGGVDRLDERQLGQRPHERGRIGRRGDHVEVLDGVGLAPQRAGDLDALGAGRAAQRVDDLVGDRERAREQHARRRAAVVAGGELLEQLLLDLGAEAAQAAQLLLLRRGAQRLERVDAELVVEPARALGAEAGEVHHRDQPARELRAQLLRLRRVARLDQRLELRLERLADPRQLGHAAVAHELLDGHGGLAHGPGGGAVGEHAVLHGAVELVEVGELLEGGCDLGVRHSLLAYAALDARSGSSRGTLLPIQREMKTEQLALVSGWEDTRAALRGWRAPPGGGDRAVAGGQPRRRRRCCWPPPGSWRCSACPTRRPGCSSASAASASGTTSASSSTATGSCWRLHAMACVAGFIAGSSLPVVAEGYSGWWRRVHDRAGRLAIGFVACATLFSLSHPGLRARGERLDDGGRRAASRPRCC